MQHAFEVERNSLRTFPPSIETYLTILGGFPPRMFYLSASTRRAQIVRPTDLLNNVKY